MYEDYPLPIDLAVNHPKALSLSVKAEQQSNYPRNKEKESEDPSYVDKIQPVKYHESVFLFSSTCYLCYITPKGLHENFFFLFKLVTGSHYFMI